LSFQQFQQKKKEQKNQKKKKEKRCRHHGRICQLFSGRVIAYAFSTDTLDPVSCILHPFKLFI